MVGCASRKSVIFRRARSVMVNNRGARSRRPPQKQTASPGAVQARGRPVEQGGGAPVSILVVGVKIVERGGPVAENFFRTEETRQFNGCRLGRVGRMDDVFLETHAIVAADGARSGQSSVGGAGQRAHGRHGVHAGQAERHDGGRHHRVLHALEKGLRAQVGIVLTEDGVVELHHFHAADLQAFLLKDADDFAGQRALQRAGLQQYECFFDGHWYVFFR